MGVIGIRSTGYLVIGYVFYFQIYFTVGADLFDAVVAFAVLILGLILLIGTVAMIRSPEILLVFNAVVYFEDNCRFLRITYSKLKQLFCSHYYA